jgi:hypothetical protein
MVKSIITTLALVSACFALNYGGYGDTATINGVVKDSVKWSPWFKLSIYENCRIVLCANDTTAAGFKSDSVNLSYGWQTGGLMLNSNRRLDTIPDANRILFDTLTLRDTTKMINGVGFVAAVDKSTGIITYQSRVVDTGSVTGFACQSQSFSPDWNVYIRFFVKGESGTKIAVPVKVFVTLLRRAAVKVVP